MLHSCSLFSQHQLSTARTEQECNTKEIGQHKLIISEKEEKMKTLSQELQKQESLIAKLERELAAAREGGATRELELLQCIVKVTDEAAGLRDKLEEAKEEKWEAVRKMEAGQAENKLLQDWMTELREQQTAYKVSSASTYSYLITSTIIVWLSLRAKTPPKDVHPNPYRKSQTSIVNSKAHLHLLYTCTSYVLRL